MHRIFPYPLSELNMKLTLNSGRDAMCVAQETLVVFVAHTDQAADGYHL